MQAFRPSLTDLLEPLLHELSEHRYPLYIARDVVLHPSRRHVVWVVGCSGTLQSDIHWGDMLAHHRQHASFHELSMLRKGQPSGSRVQPSGSPLASKRGRMRTEDEWDDPCFREARAEYTRDDEAG